MGVRLATVFLISAMALTGRLYGNPWNSVQARACTEIISFPYTPSEFGPPGPKIGLNHPRIAPIRKTVPFRTPAGPAEIRSAFMIEAELVPPRVRTIAVHRLRGQDRA